MNIGVLGLGYVGSTCLGCLSELGHRLMGVDIELDKVDMINDGRSTVYEQGLDDLIYEGVKNQKIIVNMKNENLQLKELINTLRDELERKQIDREELLQKEVVNDSNINKQLKSTIKSLRNKMETKEANWLEEIQKADIIKRDEHEQLVSTINILREKLEKKSANKKN